jgi:hypothetical protein
MLMVRRQNLLRCRGKSVENSTQIVHCTHNGPRGPRPAMVLKKHSSL